MKFATPLVLGLCALAALLFAVHAGTVEVTPPITDQFEPETPALAAPVALQLSEPVAEPIAVIELFTSEGCSSCPPADRLLLDLVARDDARLFPIAFHVDYWNRLGWTDPFSDAAYSQRQRAYARVTGSGRVYTPQMIVNGTQEFVGSRRAAAEGAIQRALSSPALATIELKASVSRSEVQVDYTITDAPDDAVLNLALVERQTEQAVPRGENAGRTLRHANVVRAFETVSVDAGSQTLTLPRGLAARDAAIVAYVQADNMTRIVGASQLPLSR